MLSLSTESLAAGAPVAPAAGAPPASIAFRGDGDDRFNRILRKLSGDAGGADALDCDAAGEAAAGDGAKCGAAFSKTDSSEAPAESAESKDAAPNLAADAALIIPAPVVAQTTIDPVTARAFTHGTAGEEGDSTRGAERPGRQVSDAAAGADWRFAQNGRVPAAARFAAAASQTAADEPSDDVAGADAGAGIAPDAAVDQAAEATLRRSARTQPTPAELRVAAGLSSDIRTSIRLAGGNAAGGGRDAGAASDHGSRSSASNTPQAQFPAAASDLKVADASQLAPRAAATLAADLLTAPHLQNALRSPALESAAAMTLDRDGSFVSSQVVESIRMQWVKGAGDAQMTLQPGYLGGLSVSLRVDKDVVTASVLAESPAVREWLRANEGSLRQGLIDVGLRLEKFQVSEPSAQTPSRDAESRDRSSGRDRQPAPRPQRPDATDSTFEVIAE